MPTKLGQNFLRDQAVLKKIIESADLRPTDFVIEIGPGEGVLTKELVKYAKKVLAIEIDKNLADKLTLNFQKNEKIKIINEDILKINLPELIKENAFNEYKIIANIPYYITSPIIRLFLETPYPPNEMILMIQSEVAERICSLPGKMSLLSVSVQYYAQPKLLFYVDKKSFSPMPKVDSAVIQLSAIRNQESGNNKEEIKHFFKIVKAGFSSKRKTLLNNLSASLKISKIETENILEKAHLKTNQRAQELSLDDWKKLSQLFL